MHDMQLIGKTYMRFNAYASRGIYSIIWWWNM